MLKNKTKKIENAGSGHGHLSFFFGKVLCIIIFKLINIYLPIYFWLCWVFIAAHRLFIAVQELSLVAANGGCTCSAQASHWGGFSCCRAWAVERSGFSSWGTQV